MAKKKTSPKSASRVKPKTKASAKKKVAKKAVKKTPATKAKPAKKRAVSPAKKKAASPAKKKAAPVKKKTVKSVKKSATPARKKTVEPVKKTAAPPKKVASKATKKTAAPNRKESPPAKNATAKAPARTRQAKPAAARKPSKSRVKVLPRDFLIEIGTAIRDAVQPLVLDARGGEIQGSAASGDATFQVDKVAEKALLAFLREARMPVAYYSEDAGYTTFTSSQPEHLLVVDPIDGSRAAKSGFESCVVSVCSTRVIERPTLADVDNGCVMEILRPRTFYAERGKGARIYIDGQYKKPKLSKNADLETVTWSMTVPARPAELIFPTAAKLIDLTSLKGGFFACNSTSYSLTRLLTHQLDACVDFANRYLRDLEDVVEDQFINAGRGVVLGIAPYDICASVLIAREAGCIVTDAYGNTFDDMLLLDSSVSNQKSLIAAANAELHDKLLSFFDIRIKQFERLLKRRAELTS
ncbi:MAG: hypothetical protein GY851_12545 [bacterium]|nr:hypothetical protein [bacterium]